MSKASNPTEVLVAAKWLLENFGWNKGAYAKYGADKKVVSFCAIGAIAVIETDDPSLFSKAIDHLVSVVGGAIVPFNDNPKRTKKQVLKAFDKAIEKSKE